MNHICIEEVTETIHPLINGETGTDHRNSEKTEFESLQHTWSSTPKWPSH